VLPAPDATDVAFRCIWDTHGIDTITFGGDAGCVIDLRSATLDYSSGGGGYVSYNAGISGGFTIAAGVEIENASGGAHDDFLQGNSLANWLVGGGGSDRIWGDAGNDIIVIGTGSDGSSIDGGADTDKLSVSGIVNSLAVINSIEEIELASGAALTLTGIQVSGGLALTTAITGTGSLTINVTAGVLLATKLMSFGAGVALTINGTATSDIMKLGNAVQTVNGGDGTDQIKGGSQVDTINGGAGIDKIMGLGGADVLTGGTGNDVFRYLAQSDSGLSANADRITDFAIGQDRMNFKDIDADAVTAGDQAFTFLGNGAFTSPGTGQIRYQDSGADLLVLVDVNGDGAADMAVILQGLAGQVLTGVDFVL
jgi:Ca2+-binding RTX toxin-like protein